MDMNRELMSKVRDRIAAVGAENCDMDTWSLGAVFGRGEPDCGTSACIAGYTIAVAEGTFDWAGYAVDGTARDAADLLGIEDTSLFYTNSWPESYRNLARDEGDQKAMVTLLDDVLSGKVRVTRLGLKTDSGQWGAS